jgi:hypothetical protein
MIVNLSTLVNIHLDDSLCFHAQVFMCFNLILNANLECVQSTFPSSFHLLF